jgi:levansucrase
MSTTSAAKRGVDERAASLWTAAHVAGLSDQPYPQLPVIDAAAARAILPGQFLWDVWPVQGDDGAVAAVAGGSLWVFLSAPRGGDPDARHHAARMRLLWRHDERWIDCGALLPDGLSPGSREWSGSTRLDAQTREMTLWFTAAGRRGEAVVTFDQRLFSTVGQLDLSGPVPRVRDWAVAMPSFVNDGSIYADLAIDAGVAGRIKGMRDPYWFRDPADGAGYLIFTASKPHGAGRSHHDGVIGIAEATDRDGKAAFLPLPPLIDADGVTNEMELPHVIVRDGLYYLFWSTQHSVFAPDLGMTPPTGLYGMVAPSLFGPYAPLNETGLVIANPAAEPRQGYAWKVLPSLEVVSFIDYWGLGGCDPDNDPALKIERFGGTIAPPIRIAIDGRTTRLIDPTAGATSLPQFPAKSR